MRWIHKYVNTQAVKYRFWAESRNHAQQGELPQVEDSSGWQAASKEVNNWGWGVGVEAEKALKLHLVVVI